MIPNTVVGACVLAFVLAVAAPSRADTAAILEGVDVAALAASPGGLFAGGFDAGLFRVRDGQKVEPLDDPALNRNINALAWDTARRVLWVGTARGLAACAVEPAFKCTRLGDAASVHALLLLADGVLAVGGDAGLGFVDRERRAVTWGRKEKAPFRSVWSLGVSGDSTLFVGATNGLFWGARQDFETHRGDAIHRASLVNGQLPDDWITAVAVQGGRLYVGTYNAGVASFEVRPGAIVAGTADAKLGFVNPAGIVPLGGDRLAVATMSGLRVGAVGTTRALALSHPDVTAVVAAAPVTGKPGYFVATRRGVQWLSGLVSAE